MKRKTDMPKWLKRVRGAVGMGLLWGLGWAVVGGAIMEGIVDPHGKILDMWPQSLAIVGFFAGVAFSTVLGIAARRRTFDEFSLPQFAVWGAVGGLLLGGLAVATGGPVVVIAVTTFGSAIAASASLIVARRVQARGLFVGGVEASDALLSEDKTSKLRG
jgi:hypothetical protein